MVKAKKDSEISIVEFITFLWSSKIYLIRNLSIGAVFGIILVMALKNEYKATCELLPEDTSGIGALGSLGGLAGLAGISFNENNANGSLTSDLYPKVSNSMPFTMRLANEKIKFSKLDTLCSTFDYFDKVFEPSIVSKVVQNTVFLPFRIKDYFTKKDGQTKVQYDNIIVITKDEKDIYENVQNRLVVNSNKKTGIITITAEMPDPIAATYLANTASDFLKEYVVNYKTDKQKANFQFISARSDEAHKKLDEARNNLAEFSDENKYLNQESAKIQKRVLENEFNIAFEMFKSLSTQKEQANIKLKEETPVFTLLTPAIVPVEKSSPRRLITLIGIELLVFGLSVAYLLFKNDFFGIR